MKGENDVVNRHTKHDSNMSKEERTTTVVFSLGAKANPLGQVASLLKQHAVQLRHLETRPSRTDPDHTDFLLIVDSPKEHEEVIAAFKAETSSFRVVSDGPSQGKSKLPPKTEKNFDAQFPRHISELDSSSDKSVDIKASYDSTPPGWDDPNYRARRKEIETISNAYRYGKLIQDVEYLPEEVNTWRKVFETQTKKYSTHACKEFNTGLKMLQEAGVYSADRIPQHQEVSDFLSRRTGFTLRPAAGFLTSRDFLNSLAFRQFNATQFIRHHKHPLYTPEPDVCHDMLGHVPMFLDPDFAEFSQELGLASLGASDKAIELLSNVYWYTLEFGQCLENGQRKLYGAGLLSGMAELERSLDPEVKTLPFDPAVAAVEKYIFDGFQHLYFVAESFKSATIKIKEYAKKFPRPYIIRYNPLTSSVEVLDNHNSISQLMDESCAKMEMAKEALATLSL